ncbi:D-3-phosphoglycerate dehydrogenase [Natrialba magadii ATCC 43099]|uniref:D-3-phosphoglycerate dehydrogenase n=1 Tax=Natrialba magadii (strain ATCC 43099 / DSM 3394 / CCM 3739 / CIP 104546 / IAM 13178 / JCM 8861 / NBRC 102185 / NCIMB 2190 / MS3) TaxID=547559 RepID=D3SV52_NATMM|nr:phosphoglycerate dehydrogenase [Natrialba magadii]ADD05460.1 D-3-phosphoglycerate dehydrogenase [Natrialba magadii ATCC 43099]ELY29227.1 D-3-phosphoglycerate dehydrogenase [Natrialba magadii ATCC 43099]
MNVLVTDPIADAGLDVLRDAGHDVETGYELEGEDLLEAVSTANGLIVRSGTEVTEDVLEAAEDLVIVGRAGIGVDNIDIEAATDNGVIVANAPEGNVRAAAEHTVAMTFAAARSIPQAHIRLKDGEWAKSEYLGAELDSKTLGVVGLGRVGQEVAKKLDSLGMDIVAFDPYISEERADRLGAELVDFEDCLARADFLTIHTPLTPETEGMIGPDELDLLEGGYVVNVGRGGIIQEDALATKVEDGTVAGAALDVFAEEPLSPESPLLEHDDVIVTPHLGASTEAAQENVATSTAEQVNAALAAEPVANALNAPSIDESAFPRLEPYIDIAETGGKVAAQLLDDRIEDIEVTYEGDIADEDIEFVTASALKGVFEPLEWQVNAVNAPQIAEDRGVDVTESKTRQAEDFQSLISVTVSNDDESITVDGTLFAGDDPRIVRVDGYRVDAIPHGKMVVTRNTDEPGVIGLIGTVMGKHGVNIAGMFNAREAHGGEALTVYNVDSQVPDAAKDELNEDDRIIGVDYITLNGQN